MSKKPQDSSPKKEGQAEGKALTAKGQALRDRIQAQIDQATEAHRKELFRHRIELARGGVRSYTLRRIPEAVKSFSTYLQILEDWKKVPEGGLTPGHFDSKEDAAELLLISGVYWDLVKLYDRTKSAERYAEFNAYIEKYIEFTLGQPYQPLAAETVRKYIVADKPVHKKEFKELHKRISDAKCFVATALVDVQQPRTTPVLRAWRDQVLRKHPMGRAFVFLYQDLRLGRLAAEVTEHLPDRTRSRLGALLDHLARYLEPRLS
jgi:hypothetical protein